MYFLKFSSIFYGSSFRISPKSIFLELLDFWNTLHAFKQAAIQHKSS